MHVELIGLYRRSIRQYNTGGANIKSDASLTCMTIIDPTTSWFEITKVLMFDLDEVMGINIKYIDKSSARLSQLLNSTCICIYTHPQKVLFANGFEFKQDFTTFLKEFDIKHVLATIKKTTSQCYGGEGASINIKHACYQGY